MPVLELSHTVQIDRSKYHVAFHKRFDGFVAMEAPHAEITLNETAFCIDRLELSPLEVEKLKNDQACTRGQF